MGTGLITAAALRRFAVLFGLFTFLPLCLIVALGLYALDLEEGYRQEREARALTATLESIVRRIDSPGFLRQRFTAFASALMRNGMTPTSIDRAIRSAQRLWQFEFEAYCFNDAGKVITPRWHALRNKYVVSKVWEIVTGMASDTDALYNKHRAAIIIAFGNQFQAPREIQGLEGILLPMRLPDSDGFWMWQRERPGSLAGTVLVVRRAPTPRDALGQLMRGRLPPRDTFAFADGEARTRCLKPAVDNAALAAAVRRFNLYREKWFVDRDTLWASARVGDLTLFAGRPQPGIDLDWHRWLLVAATVVLLAIAAVIWFRWVVLGKSIYVSIRLKLTTLFVFALLLPLLGISFLGWRNVRNQEEVLVSQTYNAAGEALHGLDVGTVDDLPRLHNLCRTVRDSPLLRPVDVPRFARWMRRLEREHALGRAEIRDIGNNVIWTTDTTQVGLKGTFQIFAQLCLDKHLPDRQPPNRSNLPGGGAAMMGAELFASPEMGFLHIMQRPDFLHPLRFGPNRFWWYWDFYRDPSHPLAFLTLSQNMEWQIERYLLRHLNDRRSFRGTAFRCFARHNLTGRWYPRGRPRTTASLENLAQQVQISRQQTSAEIVIDRRRFLATAIPGTSCEDHVLLALYPRSGIDAELTVQRTSIGFGMAVALLIAAMIGMVLSETFLAPITDLSRGIGALRARDTSYRVVHLQADELGDLAKTFNQMMDDVKEMELAKVVQESLIPSKLPAIPGYEVDLCNLTASDLGGDYCDVLALDDGRVILLIGDVTGHGVSSALLMAMAKAAMFMALEVERDVVGIMARMNRLVHRLLGRKKLMTFFLALLDPRDHSLVFSNAGHPFPMRCSAAGKTEELTLVHYPLGLSNKGAFKSQRLELAPGDVLVLYTDGIIEATNSRGDMIGYRGFADLLVKHRHGSAHQIRTALVDACRDQVGGTAWQDDVTLVILKRTETTCEVASA